MITVMEMLSQTLVKLFSRKIRQSEINLRMFKKKSNILYQKIKHLVVSIWNLLWLSCRYGLAHVQLSQVFCERPKVTFRNLCSFNFQFTFGLPKHFILNCTWAGPKYILNIMLVLCVLLVPKLHLNTQLFRKNKWWILFYTTFFKWVFNLWNNVLFLTGASLAFWT